MTARVRVHAPGLSGRRPVSASRVVGGPVRLLFAADRRERAGFLAATAAAVVATSTLVAGLVVVL